MDGILITRQRLQSAPGNVGGFIVCVSVKIETTSGLSLC